MDVTEELKDLVMKFKQETGIIFKYANFMTHEEMHRYQLWLLQRSDIKFNTVANRKY